ncbi:MAG TPA: MgtC/SapB family protein, partial [Rhodocyclaceae bacterium]|nr:MgtC/SapB family protein [Rhodocyclaceae bacterium]
RSLINNLGFQVSELSYRLHGEPKMFEYRLVLSSKHVGAARKLAEVLTLTKTVAEFRIAPSKD